MALKHARLQGLYRSQTVHANVGRQQGISQGEGCAFANCKQHFQAVALPRPPPPPKSSESTVVNEAPVPAARSKWAPKADGAEGSVRLLSREEVMLERMADVVVRKVAQFLPPPAGQEGWLSLHLPPATDINAIVIFTDNRPLQDIQA